MSTTDHEALAEGFATAGREELLARFRDAYAKAAGAHSDYVSLDPDTLESIVQRSVAEADGLQWRRALAGVAARELDIDLGVALTHPAVVRAHQLAGAPSYEKALSELAVPVPPAPVAPVPEPPAVPQAPAVPKPPVAATVEVPPEVEELPDATPAVVADVPAPSLEVEVEAEPVASPAVASSAEPTASVDAPTMAYALPVPTDDPVAADADAEQLDAVAALSHDGEAEPEAEVEAEPEAEVEAEAEIEPEAEAEPSGPAISAADEIPAADETLARRADEFAEEFLIEAEDADAADDEADFTYEHEVLPESAAVDPDANGGPGRDDVAEFAAVHLGGVASLPSAEEIALRLSEVGLDLMHDDGNIVGRLGWEDISALEVTVPHGRRRRKGSPRLVVHTSGGSARFEVPELSGEELQERLQPLMARYGH